MSTKLLPSIDETENRIALYKFHEIVYSDSPWLLDSYRFIWQTLLNPLQGKNESFDGVAYAVGITHASTLAFLKSGWVLVEDALLLNKIINPIPNLKYLKMPFRKILVLAPIIKVAGKFFDFLRNFNAKKSFVGVSFKEILKFEPEWDR